MFSVHGGIAKHYGIDEGRLARAARRDHRLRDCGAGRLNARHLCRRAGCAQESTPNDGRLSCEVRGEVESEGGVLVIKRVHVTHTLRAEDPRCRARGGGAGAMACTPKSVPCIGR